MLNVSAQHLEGVTILRCQGRIVAGEENAILWDAALSGTDTHALILDLREVDRIDAGGLGLLLRLLAWTRSRRIQFNLVNLTRKVRHLFELTRLDHVFAISTGEILDLPRSGASLDQGQSDGVVSRILEDNRV
jgi:anti-anti-sigma factor